MRLTGIPDCVSQVALAMRFWWFSAGCRQPVCARANILFVSVGVVVSRGSMPHTFSASPISRIQHVYLLSAFVSRNSTVPDTNDQISYRMFWVPPSFNSDFLTHFVFVLHCSDSAQ